MATEAATRERRMSLPLSQREWQLIEELRKYPYSEITIEMHNGQPLGVLKGVAKVRFE